MRQNSNFQLIVNESRADVLKGLSKVFSITVILLLLPGICLGSSATENSNDLQISLHKFENSYNLYDPIPLDISLYSDTETSLIVDIIITDKKQKESIFFYKNEVVIPSGKTILLGDVTDAPVWIPTDAGEYAIEARVSTPSGGSERETASISVVGDKTEMSSIVDTSSSIAPSEENILKQKKVIGKSDIVILTEQSSGTKQQSMTLDSINVVSEPISPSSLNKAIAFNATWSIPAYPVGYPYTDSPIIYGNQNLTINGAVKNVGSGSITNAVVTVTVEDKNSNIVSYILNNAVTDIAELETKSLNDIATENGIELPLQWNPDNAIDMHYVKITVVFDGISDHARTESFTVGNTKLLDFQNVRTNNNTYLQSEIVTLYSGALIENTGNQNISGTLNLDIWKWDNETKTWDTSFRNLNSTPINLNSGDVYYLTEIWPPSGLNISSYGNGTFKVNFAVTDKIGNILDQKVGETVIGEMQLGMPSVKVEKTLDEPVLSPGSQTATVNLRVMPSGDSIRDSGIFTIGEESRVTDLDIVFVADTSGSMSNEWRDLVSVMEDIINSLSEHGNVTHSVYGLSRTYSGYTSYTVNGVIYSIQSLPSIHCESYGEGTEYLAQNYCWRPGSVRVIFPIGDEGPYHGAPNDIYDTRSIDAAIVACNANDVIAYPMYGDYGGSVEAQNIAHMERLAAATGGVVTHWQDTESVLNLVNTSVAGEIKFAGEDVVITENILDTDNVQVDLDSFTVSGGNILNSVNGCTHNNITTVVIDENNIPELDSITTVPPEEILIQYNIELNNLTRGELREITKAGMLNYTDIMDEPQSESIPLSGDSTYVRGNAESDVLVIVDWNRMNELYPANDVNDLSAALDDYAIRKNATIYNLSEYRVYWENNISNTTAYSSEKKKREWARYLDNVITSLVLDRNAEHVMIVGGDNAVPFYSINLDDAPVGIPYESRYRYAPHTDYDISSSTDNNLWSDETYADLNGDFYPDVSLGRIPGTPDIIKINLENTILTYESETALMASMNSTVNLRDKQIATMLKDEWGFNWINTYFEEADDISDLVDSSGFNFTQRLANDNNSIVFMNGHGNDYGSWTESHYITDESNFDGPEIYLNARDVTIKNSTHPFVSSEACHGGIVFPEDDALPEWNFPLSFLSKGAVGYLGATGYAPFGGSDDLGYYFYKIAKEKNEVGKSLLLAKREILNLNNNSRYWIAAFEFQLYGDPTYVIDVPNDPPGEVGYSFITYENSSSINMSLLISEYNVTNVNISNETLQLVHIPGTFDYFDNFKPVVPVITYTFELPPNIDVTDLDYSSNNIVKFENLTLPLYNLGPKSVEGGYISPANYSGELYPNKTVEVIKVEEVSMNKSVTIRIYPLQYNHTNHEGMLYTNFTITTHKVEEPPLPLARLSADMQASEVNLAGGLTDDFYLTVKNNGELDLKDINIDVSIPGGFTVINSAGSFNETARVLNIKRDALDAEVLNDFWTSKYTVKAPNTQEYSDYVFNYTVTCTDEAGNSVSPVSGSTAVNVTPGSDGTGGTNDGGSSGSSGLKATVSNTSEAFENIRTKASRSCNVVIGKVARYEFDEESYSISYVEFKGLTNASQIRTSLEVLKDTSALVDSPAPGNVYQNINIWVGSAAFGDDKIEDAVVGFRVSKSWLEENGIDESGVALYRYNDGWTKLSTVKTSEDDEYVYFEAETPGFSPFAISATTGAPDEEDTLPSPGFEEESPTGDIEGDGADAETGSTPGFGVLPVAGVLLVAALVLRRKEG
jgi:PGF-pre-PGF domain-containing protein